MKSPLKGDGSVGVPYSKSGLRDAHRRGIMRLIFVATGVTLAIFAVFQVFNNNPGLALLELVASGLLLFGATRVMKTLWLHAWIYGYLVCVFSFFLYIITMPRASSTAFVWVFIMPILSYLLLGRVAGFFLAFPFMLAGGVFFYLQLDALTNAGVMIDLLNPMFCAILILMFMHVYEIRRADAQDRLVTLAETDALTGMANRSSFQASLERILRESQRNRRQFALVLMDIDHFKRVNDTLGHIAGDEILRHIGRRLTERLRNTDFVGRLGGEEFGLIVREVAPRDAEDLVNELRQRIADTPAHYEGTAVALTATFGIAFWPADAEKLNELYQIADRRLYDGKKAGRNRVIAGEQEAMAAQEQGSPCVQL